MGARPGLTALRCLRSSRRSLADHAHLMRLSTRKVSTAGLPRVLQPSLWRSMLPSIMRQSEPASPSPSQHGKIPWRDRPWNPATYFIVMALLIGSNAIQIIALKRYTLNYTRKTEAKLALLREVIDRVQAGEDVDVEGLLGTGQPDHEADWEEVIKEVEQGNQRPFVSRSKLRTLNKEKAKETAAETSVDVPVDAAAKKEPGFY